MMHLINILSEIVSILCSFKIIKTARAVLSVPGETWLLSFRCKQSDLSSCSRCHHPTFFQQNGLRLLNYLVHGLETLPESDTSPIHRHSHQYRMLPKPIATGLRQVFCDDSYSNSQHPTAKQPRWLQNWNQQHGTSILDVF